MSQKIVESSVGYQIVRGEGGGGTFVSVFLVGYYNDLRQSNLRYISSRWIACLFLCDMNALVQFKVELTGGKTQHK